VGEPYEIEIVKEFPITSTLVTGSVYFPYIANAIVTMTAWSYSYQQSVFESFTGYDAGETIFLAPSLSWNTPAVLDAPAPNTDCWDAFENYPDTGPTQIVNTIYGYRWDGDGIFNGVDRLDCYDDFESYSTVGEIFAYAGGVGWNGAGASEVATYLNFWDDFESYAVGSVTVLDFRDFNNYWNGDGTFLDVEYPYAYDDFESYTAGVITVFNFTATDNLWNGDGRAIT